MDRRYAAPRGGWRGHPDTSTMTLAEYGTAVMPLALRGLEGKTLDPCLAGWRKRVVPALWPPVNTDAQQWCR